MRNGLIAFRQIPATLIGPPSQYSHLRPIRYASEDATTPNQQHHPYEPTNQIDHFSSEELSFDLSRRKLDNFNDKFWSDNNIRCEHALKEFVGDAEGERRQVLLQQFWRDWSFANHERYYNWSKYWWSAQLSLLYPALKLSIKQSLKIFL
ncbi:hypothetical protein E3P92_01106 [Wallemia ichthyophaga]|uniref:Apoptogenic protein 1, mitochondrial n=2 Tax=Wallemia ichthyophaga TaxID=245174 RepID=A0A4V4M982_WALIC|nr:uncharacterized protein J056_002058 [Wallemia ichthyophaga EXF-994]TIA74646.1 hypothetical protein E3P91_00813 [Wallemia ichthyophaga]EOR03980.1 hypothetical protein J056_002058 [Wallemia ichthyophaga EXF-994]TIA83083.1 hypothetical protein E3P98_00959 [Wallemia ichthyophaga]TIA92026.1 hypothetical protein E3P97_01647 [Wallemia ichthyophaga]TIA98506.1 hypothetical protein E3P96_03141 [Wallemia ichthyophaga]